MAGKKPPRDEGERGAAASDTRFDRDVGAIVGDPHGFRFATGRENVDVKSVGPEMLRNRRPGGGAID